MDDNRSLTLDKNEFKKAIADFRVDVTPEEAGKMFDAFDKDKGGEISYDEFVRGVRGPMANFRVNLVKQAFKKLDKSGDGVVDISDIKGVYNAKFHPDVVSGKKSEDDVLGEFLETFESHHNMGTGKNNQSVTVAEFLEYYNNVSASIDNDEYFELMMNNAWKLGERPAYEGRSAWKGEDNAPK